MRRDKQKTVSHVIGVHFGATKITAVEMRLTGSGATVLSKGSADMRPGYLNPAVTASSASIGAQLAALLKHIGATTNVAMFDVPASFTAVRQFNFPNMPDEDMRAVVEGEVRHANLLADAGGAFDFLRVGTISDTGEANVVAVAADDAILWYLADIAKHAKLRLLARVPSHIAMLRALLMGAPPTSSTLYVTVSTSTTELSVVGPNGVQLYRRIDVRGSDLVVESARLDELERLERESEGLLQEDVPLSLQAIRSGGKFVLDPVIVQRLLTETRRSIEFLRRSKLEGAAIARTVLAITDDRWTDLQPALAESIGVPCVLADVKGWVGMETTTDSNDYLVALGLAAQSFTEEGFALPPINLEPKSKRTERLSGTRSGIASAAISACVLFVVVFVSWIVFWVKNNGQNAENDRLQAQYKKLENEYLPKQEKFRAEVEAIADLATKGIPFGPIMDEMSLSLDPTVGIIASTFDLGGRITIQGQTKTELAIVNTLGKLRQIGGFNATFVDSFEDRKDKGLVFNISTNYDLTFPARRAADEEAKALVAGKVDGEKKILGGVIKQ